MPRIDAEVTAKTPDKFEMPSSSACQLGIHDRIWRRVGILAEIARSCQQRHTILYVVRVMAIRHALGFDGVHAVSHCCTLFDDPTAMELR